MGSGLNVQCPPAMTSGCSGRRSSARTGMPARSRQFSTLVYDELGGEAEGEHVEVAGGVVGVDREERDAAGARISAFMSSHGA